MMKKDLRIVFMGTPEFAVPSLEILVEQGHNIVAVITAPDKPSGRGLKLNSSPVKKAAEKAGLPILQPKNLKSEDFLNELRSLKANLQIVVAFRMLPEFVWNMPEIGTFNLHASLLPKYRGAAPINWAIINGDKETGLSTFFLKHEIDTGDIIDQQREAILDNDTAGTLYERLMKKGSELVLKTVQSIANGTFTTRSQIFSDEDPVAPKIFKENCQIDWGQPSKTVYDFIRGMSPYPCAWTRINSKIFKIFMAHFEIKDHGKEAGEIITDNKTQLGFCTIDGIIWATDVQLESKKRMKTEDLLKGYKI